MKKRAKAFRLVMLRGVKTPPRLRIGAYQGLPRHSVRTQAMRGQSWLDSVSERCARAAMAATMSTKRRAAL